MRGKDFESAMARVNAGITPAYAGKSLSGHSDIPRPWDHPCVCGEKASKFAKEENAAGSPLRMRGKAIFKSALQELGRITPAYAGKSRSSRPFSLCVRDHPCVCGEKCSQAGVHLQSTGSPLRMRGKADK